MTSRTSAHGWHAITSTISGCVAIVGLLASCSMQAASTPSATATAVTATSRAAAGTAASSITTVVQSTTTALTTSPATPAITPSPVATATPAAPVPTATPSPAQPSPTVATSAAATVGALVATSSAASTACATPPVRGFGLVWQGHPTAQALVGCPTGNEATIGVVSQQFEHGWMVQLSASAPGQSGARTIYVLFGDNATVAQVPDTWTAGTDPISTGLTPPAGLVEPQRDFGKVWREGTSLHIRQRLGWAMGAERGAAGAWQPYQHGEMIWTPVPKQIFVLGEQGQTTAKPNAWRLYPDLFAG